MLSTNKVQSNPTAKGLCITNGLCPHCGGCISIVLSAKVCYWCNMPVIWGAENVEEHIEGIVR